MISAVVNVNTVKCLNIVNILALIYKLKKKKPKHILQDRSFITLVKFLTHICWIISLKPMLNLKSLKI